MGTTKGLFAAGEFEVLEMAFWKLEMINDFQKYAHEFTHCPFIYWLKDLIPLFLDTIFVEVTEFNRLYYFLYALNDGITLVSNAKHLEDAEKLVQFYKDSTREEFETRIMKKICMQVENDLRVHLHSILIDKLKKQSPLKEGIIDIKRVIETRTLYFFDERFSIKSYVEQYLSKTFYDMTALTLHDWKTYEEMRILAKEKLGLDLQKTYLPSQNLEQGLDILYLIRNIQSFVSKFSYNLHSQVFIEVTKDTKQINTVGVKQLKNSLKMHGIGILTTTINAIYQFLIKYSFCFNSSGNSTFSLSSYMTTQYILLYF